MLSLPQRLQQLAQEAPDRPAVTCGGLTLTRHQLVVRAERLAGRLLDKGVASGGYVALLMPNAVDHVVATCASWLVGAVPQPLSPSLPTAELEAILDLTGAFVLQATDELLLDLDTGERPVLPDVVSPSWKAPTSGGSTGRPKVIVAGQAAVYDDLALFATALGIDESTVSLVTAPLSHNGPFVVATSTVLAGGHAVLMPRFDPTALLALIAAHQVSWVYAVPTMMSRLLALDPAVRAKADVCSLRVWMHMSAPCPPSVKEAFLDWLGPERVVELYAGTEAQAITLISGTEWLTHRGSVGRAAIGEIEVRLADGTPAAAREVGAVWMRAPSDRGPTYRYLGAEAVTDGDWECLGDVGWMDEEGYLYLSGRDADLILVGGANVYPAEVEAALIAVPGVLDACVIGLPDDDLGEVPHAIVRTETMLDEGVLRAGVAERLTRYKWPRSYEIVTEPLRDDAGKVRRSGLRAVRT